MRSLFRNVVSLLLAVAIALMVSAAVVESAMAPAYAVDEVVGVVPSVV